MTTLPPLPHPLEAIEPPDLLWPTLVGHRGGCLLTVAHGVMERDRLAAHPRLLVGRVLHAAAEAASSKEAKTASEIMSLLVEGFATVEAEIGSDPRYSGLVPLREHLPFSETERLLRRLRTAVSQVGEGTWNAGSGDTGASGLPTTGRTPLPAGREIGFNSKELDLKGRIDLLKRDGDTTHIIDTKSGSALSGGEIRPQYAMQLWLYGLAVEWHGETAPIRLWIDDGKRHEVPWSDEAREAAVSAIREVRAALPKGRGELWARDLAKPGHSCRWCGIRHRCATYLAEAPHWWRNPPEEHAIPLDTWGRITGAISIADGTALELIDRADRKVVVALPESVPVPDTGTTVAFFDLASDTRRRGGIGTAFRYSASSDFAAPTSAYEVTSSSPF